MSDYVNKGEARGDAWRERKGKTYDADTVNTTKPTLLALRSLRLDQIIEALAAVLLHSLQAESHVDWKVEPERLVCLENVEPAENGALVVRRPTSNQPPSLFVYDQLEWLRVPSITLLRLQPPPHDTCVPRSTPVHRGIHGPRSTQLTG